jgi:hypothetical protein
MVISFKENLAKKEIKPNLKIKLNEYKKALKNNMLLSEWIKSCIFNEDFINYNLDKLSIKETALFHKNINKTQTEFLIECRSFYKDSYIPEFFKIYIDDNYLIEFFENYKITLLEQTQKNANIVKFLISEMLVNFREDNCFEIISENNDSFIPINKFKVKNEKIEFSISLNSQDKKIILFECNNKKYNDFFENRNKDKSLVNLFVKEENVKNIEQIKKNMLFLKSTFLENENISARYFKNAIQVKCAKNEIVLDEKNAYPIFDNKFKIYDFIRK